MVSQAVEESDTVDYLAPMVPVAAASAGRRYGGDRADWVSRAWLAALKVARTYDARRNPSLWRHAWVAIPQRMLDDFRKEIGRVKAGQSPRPVPFPVGLFQETREDGDDSARIVPASEDRGYAECEARVTVSAILRDIDERDAELLTWVYLEERPIQDFAAREGVTPAAISHRLKSAHKAARKVAAA